MATEDLSFDILARDRASGTFRDVGRSASDAGDKMGLAARQARVLQDAMDAQARTAAVAAGATLALAKADKILADTETRSNLLAKVVAARSGDKGALGDLARLTGIGSGGRGGGGGIGRIAAGAAGGGGGPLSGLAGLPVVGGLSGTTGLGLTGGIGGVIAAIASLPFIAQAAAGGITTALGGSLLGLVAAGAITDKGVSGSFANVAKNASNNAVKISRSFIPVFNDIANTAVNVMAGLEPTFKGAAKILSGPFADFAGTFERSFGSRAVQVSIKAVATSFADLLKAVTPQIPGDVNAIANGITAVANSVAKNPKVFADFVFFLVHVVAGALQTVAALSNFAAYLEKHFKPAIGDTTSYISHVWDVTWKDSIGALITFEQSDQKWIGRIRHDFATGFDGIRHDIAAIWDKVLVNTLKFAAGVTGIFGKLPGPLGAPFRAAHAAIDSELAKIQFSAADTAKKINLDWNTLHGKNVTLNFGLAMEKSSQFLHGLAGGGHAGGTGGARPGWAWTGERGPELVHFHGGETVLNNAQSMRATRGYATGTVGNFIGTFPSGANILNETGQLGGALNTAMGRIIARAQMLAAAARNAAAGAGAFGSSGGLGRSALRQIENWWIGAGGPGGLTAHIAAAITGAESGFRVNAIQQGQPYATTGWGLWQITPGNSEPQAGINYGLLTGPTNAVAAVAKFRQAGNSFTPWTTFTDGAYRAFMDRGGWLRPHSRTLVTNSSPYPEQVIPGGPHGGGHPTVILQVASHGNAFDRFMTDWLLNAVTVKGGGVVQVAFGTAG